MSQESPMTSAAVPADPVALLVARVRLGPLVATAGVLTWAADFLFWNLEPGVNVGIFTALLAFGILAQRPAGQVGRGGWLALVLLLGACLQTGIELCFTNVCVLLALLLVLGGGTYYTALQPVWRRWVAQGRAVIFAPGRLGWLLSTFLAQRPAGRAQNTSEAMSRGLLIFAPAFVLVVVFMILLARGNPMFQGMLSRFGNHALDWLLVFDWSPWRVIFWLVAAAFALSFLRPRETSAHADGKALAIWHRPDQRLAWLQSVVALVMLNALFALVNTVDVAEFWSPVAAGDGVSQQEVHDGVHHLIAATVLAAVVLAAIFQQQPGLTQSRALRGLGQLWIVQNLVMAACVFRRDYYYVMETHLLTEKRIYLMCFLALVAIGYLFLSGHVQRGGRLAWLLRCNVLAAFGLFYVMQFCDVGGYASRWCAHKSLTDPAWEFDGRYWATQGSHAWPAMLMVAEAPGERGDRVATRKLLDQQRHSERNLKTDWRSFQKRASDHRNLLLGVTK